MGCSAFALLFDDIETNMNERDKKKFPSFVMAQLTVSNVVFEYIGKPLFFFCPTEYCESRAVPSLEESSYLNTLGENLHTDIHILWTGNWQLYFFTCKNFKNNFFRRCCCKISPLKNDIFSNFLNFIARPRLK